MDIAGVRIIFFAIILYRVQILLAREAARKIYQSREYLGLISKRIAFSILGFNYRLWRGSYWIEIEFTFRNFGFGRNGLEARSDCSWDLPLSIFVGICYTYFYLIYHFAERNTFNDHCPPWGHDGDGPFHVWWTGAAGRRVAAKRYSSQRILSSWIKKIKGNVTIARLLFLLASPRARASARFGNIAVTLRLRIKAKKKQNLIKR